MVVTGSSLTFFSILEILMPNSPLRIAHLIDQPIGGAAIAANRLIQELSKEKTIQVERWNFGRGESSSFNFPCISIETNFPKTILERVVRVFSKIGANSLRRKRQRKALLRTISQRNPDILHIHNLHASALTHEDVLQIPRSTRLVWTIQDCWPVSPWAYFWKNEDGSMEFQGKETRSETDALGARKRFFRIRNDVVLISPSNWLASEARTNVDSKVRIEVVPNSVSPDSFLPISKGEAKAKLGLDPSKIWIGLAAASFDRRKGADILVEALTILKRQDVGVLIWGSGQGIEVPTFVEKVVAGFIKTESQQSLLYSACDLFACPSRSESFGQVVLESMACGTPVVGSLVGGIPDIVQNNSTGWLFSPVTAHACAEAIRRSIDMREKWKEIGERARHVASGQFSTTKQAETMAGIYLGKQ